MSIPIFAQSVVSIVSVFLFLSSIKIGDTFLQLAHFIQYIINALNLRLLVFCAMGSLNFDNIR